MFNTTQRLTWFSSLATAAFLGFMTLLSGCGGGGASATPNIALSVDPASATLYMGYPTTFTITGGRAPFTVYTSDSAILPLASSSVTGNSFIVNANNVDASTSITLTVRDMDGTSATASVTVKPASLNNTLTVTDPLKAGTQGSASVTAKSITGAPLMGHPVRFRVVDQGVAYGFVCIQNDCRIIERDPEGRIIQVEITTDQNGYASAVTRADVGATTQYATITATDMTTGHVLRKQFVIAGAALSVLPTTATWTITDSTVGPVKTYSCVGAATSYYVYGGTPPYTITSLVPSIVTVGGASTTTVTASGGTFIAQAACAAEGTANLVISDATGAILGNVTFVVVFVDTP